jgi:hypothetical protein
MNCIKQNQIVMAGLLLAVSLPAWGQKWEVGAGGGGSFYNAKTITAPQGSVEAKFKPGFAASGWFGQIGDRAGGELRYTFFKNDMELAGPAGRFAMPGRAQAIHYDVLIYTNDRKAKTRGFFLVGGGYKQYSGTGEDMAFQPTGNIAVLTRTTEWKPLLTTGAGVRFALSKNAHLRAEVRGYFTRAPTEVITPVAGELSGWYFDIVPMVSLTYVWE